MSVLADTRIEGFEFIGEPFDPRPARSRAAERPAQVAALLTLTRAMVAAAHASALDAQVRLQRRNLYAPGVRP